MKKVLIIVGVFLVVGSGALLTGVVGFDDNPTHYGDAFGTPDFGVIDNEVEEVNTLDNEITVNTTFFVDNPNAIGADINSLDYDLYWSEDQLDEDSDGWEYLGEGSDNFTIDHNTNETYYIVNEFVGTEAAQAYSTQDEIYVKVEANVIVEFNGVPPFQFEHTAITRVEE